MWRLPESLIGLDRIASLGQIGLLARIRGSKILAAHESALAECHARVMRIVIPAARLPGNNPLGNGSRAPGAVVRR